MEINTYLRSFIICIFHVLLLISLNLRSLDGRCLDQSGRYGKFVFGSLKAKRNLEDPNVDRGMILKWI